MATIEMASANRQFVGVDLVRNPKLVHSTRLNTPGILCDLVPVQRPTSEGRGGEGLHMASIVADHVRSGCPGGEYEILGGSIYSIHLNLHMVEMAVGGRHTQGVADHGAGRLLKNKLMIGVEGAALHKTSFAGAGRL